MKTIHDLHKKIWYRALKVAYIIIFSLVLIFGVISIYDEINEDMFETKTDIIQSFLDDENQNYENREAIFKMLQDKIDESVVFESIKNYEGYAGFNTIFFGEIIFSTQILKFMLLVVLFLGTSYLIFFQILNRTFYYIVLGTLFPKKD